MPTLECCPTRSTSAAGRRASRYICGFDAGVQLPTPNSQLPIPQFLSLGVGSWRLGVDARLSSPPVERRPAPLRDAIERFQIPRVALSCLEQRISAFGALLEHQPLDVIGRRQDGVLPGLAVALVQEAVNVEPGPPE